MSTKPTKTLATAPNDKKDLDAINRAGNQNCCEPSLDIGTVNTVRPARSASPVYELIPGKLGFVFHPDQDFTCSQIKSRPDLFLFSTDLHERYIPFCKDFGPVSLGLIYRFLEYVRAKEHHPLLCNRPLVYYTDFDEKNQANAAVLLGAYMMLEHNMSSASIQKAFQQIPNYPFVAFRDATFTTADFGITLKDCMDGLERAITIGWFDKNTFDCEEFEDLEDPDFGDVSLIGDKFLAFRGPAMAGDEHDDWAVAPSFYFDMFKELGVTTIIRLNEPECYDKADFENAGFKVHDLEFADCTCPPPSHVKKFLDIVDGAEGKVAVHCKAGLGRTGTMIALWMMKHKSFSAKEAISYLRLCRPGSVIGQQQHFLAACETMTWAGNALVIPDSDMMRRSSSIASGAATPVAGSFVSRGAGSFRRASDSDSLKPTAEELGKQIAEAARHRTLLKRAGH
eukprot:476653-Rhodomonas_salina.1